MNPTHVRAEGTQPDNLVIYWKPMDKYDWNGPDLQYIVRYRLNEQGAKWEEARIEDPLAVSHILFFRGLSFIRKSRKYISNIPESHNNS